MTILSKTERILQAGQRFRDSDKLLLLAVWHTEGLQLTEEQRAAFMTCTTAETVTRARRALKVQYPPSPKIEEARYTKFQEYKQGEII